MMSNQPEPSVPGVPPVPGKEIEEPPAANVRAHTDEWEGASAPMVSLAHKLEAIQQEVEGYARGYGLDFYTTIFEVVNDKQLNAIAAYGGFPNRYPHWSFGMEYEQLDKGYEYGLSKIYEMVINNDPCYAYLLSSNAITDQKLVMAHVYGHCDFFKNNVYFAHTNRKMMDKMGDHATKIRELEERYGKKEVEEFIDVCKSIEDLIDIHSPAIRRQPAPVEGVDEDDPQAIEPGRFKSKDYMDNFMNPPEVIKAERERLREERDKAVKKFPEEPERDVMKFLIEHAPGPAWKREVLTILRDEAYYYAPQGQTKIMNEGWASYWHSTMMTQHLLTDAEVIDYADHHSGTMAMSGGRLNPYKIGIELFRDIEERWNTGKFGPEWENCQDMEAKANWDKNLGLGRQKIFEVRKLHCDLTFIDTFLTPEFCKKHQLFSFKHNEHRDNFEIESREFEKIKDRLLMQLTNFGRPDIRVEDGNHQNRSELYLKHYFGGVELDLKYAKDTMENIQKIWTRPVHVETVADGKPTVYSWDGKNFTSKTL